MIRRNFIKNLALASLIPFTSKYAFSQISTNGFTKPKALVAGDTIGVIAPGTAVSDPDEIERAKEALNYFSLNMKLGEYVSKGTGYKTRTVEERLSDLHNMFLDDDVKAVFCIRGGYGSGQLLDQIDYDLIKNHPKIFLGYSDITAMHLAINKYSKLITFHGPVLLSAFSQYTINYFQKALFETNPIGEVTNPTNQNSFRTIHSLRTITSGKVKGGLIGGNLTLISTTLGTPYEIDTKDKILLLEDVGEEPYRVDRMLTQLRLANKLQQARGIVFGECAGCDFSGLKSSRDWDYTLGEVLDKILGNLGIPVFFGLTFGHTSDQITLPLGIEVEMDADKKVLNFTESGVV